MTAPKRIRFLLFALVLSASVAMAQADPAAVPIQQGKKDPALKDWKPAIFPAAAISYGAALYEQAPPMVKGWCENFARTQMPKRKIDPRETMAVVDKEFPKNSDAARDAAIYLLEYLAYLEEDKAQKDLVVQIRRLDDEAHDVMLRMQTMRENETNAMASTRRTVSIQEMVRNDEEMRKMEQKLREMSDSRKQKMKELTALRKHVDGWLKVLDVTHKRMNGIEPAVMREFQ